MLIKLLLMATLAYPELSLAIGRVESGFDPRAIGDGGRSRGAFQVQERYYGPVPKGIFAQMTQHNAILGRLVGRHGVRIGVEMYNGSGPKAERYERVVARTVIRQEVLGI
jgi:hypothetical protein